MSDTTPATARYELQVARTPVLRRAWTGLLTVIGAVVALGAWAPTASLRRCHIIDRATGETVATIDEAAGEVTDLEALIRTDLDGTSAEDFERVWLSRQADPGRADDTT
ncbi:MAG: hypothetical protein ACLFRV_06055 [Acidimicrobiales bacterium]